MLLLPPVFSLVSISPRLKTMDRASLPIYISVYDNYFVPLFLQLLNCISNGQKYTISLFRIFIKFLCWILTISNSQPKAL